ncbi:uncharacterized protein LOC131252989 [Magnolia sinica]|uniref:uncharacterized protein LOC131252989 n=1 Tax=Magnolia sinica TaxID=86752 RepID=UPI00265AE7A7|nr:uncharacterized protein LOC131252989 [Magnolia sinica]
MSSYNNSNPSSFDNLLLQSLMGRLHLRPPYLHTNSFLSQSLSDFLVDPNAPISSLSDDEDDSEKTHLAKEESKLEKAIIRLILSGDTGDLKPNSGQAVTVGDHHICVGFHEEKGSDYRVWEWHGHIMLFDEENGYTPEYIYGNYFERRARVEARGSDGDGGEEEEEKEKEKESGGGNLGLRELIGGGDEMNSRILRRNLNVGSPR